MKREIDFKADSPSCSPCRRWWIIAGLLLLVDLAKHSGLIALGQTQPWPDSYGYWSLATAAANGDWWLVQSGQASRTPGYLWFLAFCQLTAGQHALVLAIIVQHVLGMITAMLTGWLTARITNSRWAGLLAYGVMVALSARDFYANSILTESLATLLQIVVICLLVRGMSGQDRWLFVFACGATGLGILVRPAMLVLVPILGAWLWSQPKDLHVGPKRKMQVVFGTFLLLALIAPWCLRNYHLFGRFTLSAFLGRELWTAHFSPWPGGELEIPDSGPGAEVRERVAKFDGPVNLRHNWSVSDALTASGLNDAEADEFMSRTACNAIIRNPRQALLRTLARCLTFWYTKDWPPPKPVSDQQVFADQRSWTNSGLTRFIECWLTVLPERQFPCVWLFAFLTWSSILAGILSGPHRRVFLLIGVVLLLTTFMTAALEIPLYRYRMGLEPIMVAAIIAAGNQRYGFGTFRRKVPE